MKILLLNDNPVVNKLVTLSAQKTSDELDVVDSIDSIQSGEYDLLVVDDTMYNDDMFSKIKSKIMFSSSLYICSRDAAPVEAFSSTLKKPFLPTDLVELFLMFAKKAESVDTAEENISADIDELEEFHSEEADEELVLDEDLDLSLDEELEDLDDDLLLEDDELMLEDDDLILDEELVLEDDDLNLDDELLLEDDELEDLDEELLLGDDDIEDGESVLDDEEAQKVKDLLDETSDDEATQKTAEYDPQFAADELGLPVEEIEEFIQDFINQAYEFKDELYSSLQSGDTDNIHALSHKIKGVAANLRMEEALNAISIVNTSSDNAEIEASLDNFYTVVDRLSGVNTSSSSEEETTSLDELEEFNTEELEVEEEELDQSEDLEEGLTLEDDDLELSEELELELDDELLLKEEPEEVNTSSSSEEEESTDLDELEDELMFDEEEAESEIDKAVTEELALDEDVDEPEEELELDDELTLEEEVNTSTSSEEEESADLEELEEFSSEELELEEDVEESEEEIADLDELNEEFGSKELELEEKVEEPEAELDLETQIENAVEELSDEDLESELDEETLLEIATNEISSIDSFDSLTSNDLKLAIGEEVNTEIPEISSDETNLESFDETQEDATATATASEEVETNSIEALENLLAALKDKNVAASMKGTKININITIGDE